MKCISVNGHDYSTRAYGNPTATAALNNVMRTMARKSQPPRPRLSRIQYINDGQTQVVRYDG